VHSTFAIGPKLADSEQRHVNADLFYIARGNINMRFVVLLVPLASIGFTIAAWVNGFPRDSCQSGVKGTCSGKGHPMMMLFAHPSLEGGHHLAYDCLESSHPYPEFWTAFAGSLSSVAALFVEIWAPTLRRWRSSRCFPSRLCRMRCQFSCWYA
jgi:hypothetical protein